MAAWALITGDKGDGKTARALAAADRLRERGLRVGGFVQQVVPDADGTRLGYDLLRLAGGTAIPLARRTKTPETSPVGFCSYAFEPSAFARAREWLLEDSASADVLIIDGVGKLETASQGHAETVRFALALPAPVVVVLCVRAEQLFAAVSLFLGEAAPDPVATLEVSAREDTLARFVEAVARAARAGA